MPLPVPKLRSAVLITIKGRVPCPGACHKVFSAILSSVSSDGKYQTAACPKIISVQKQSMETFVQEVLTIHLAGRCIVRMNLHRLSFWWCIKTPVIKPGREEVDRGANPVRIGKAERRMEVEMTGAELESLACASNGVQL